MLLAELLCKYPTMPHCMSSPLFRRFAARSGIRRTLRTKRLQNISILSSYVSGKQLHTLQSLHKCCQPLRQRGSCRRWGRSHCWCWTRRVLWRNMLLISDLFALEVIDRMNRKSDVVCRRWTLVEAMCWKMAWWLVLEATSQARAWETKNAHVTAWGAGFVKQKWALTM